MKIKLQDTSHQKSRELFLETNFKKSQERVAPWKKNIKELECLKTFLEYCLVSSEYFFFTTSNFVNYIFIQL